MTKKPPLTYEKAGVNAEKADAILGSFSKYLKTRPKDPAVLSGIGPFASCYSLKEGLGRYHDPVLVTCCDGVGTKAKLALEWGKIDTLGEDLVAMNVNDLLCAGATPTLFLDYYACGALGEDQLLPILKSIQHGCELAHCSLVGGETAEMPGVYAGADFDLAGFAVGFADKERLLGPDRVREGDVLLALASSGPHSNGYSLIRKLVEKEKLSPTAKVPFGTHTWREVLLKPTTIYVRALVDSLPKLHALAHLTGGGLFENLPRVLPHGFNAHVYSQRWEIPPLFLWLQQAAGLTTQQLLTTFNGGVGMIAVCARQSVEAVVAHVEKNGVHCWEIGSAEKGRDEAEATVIWE